MKFVVDPKGSLAPSEQLAEQVRLAVAARRLDEGERLPSVRQLAGEALVNPNTVARCYRQLEWEEIVETRPGDGVFVAIGASAACAAWRDAQIRTRLKRALDDARGAGLTTDRLMSWIGAFMEDRMEESEKINI
ncbi:MAG: GntR family transcriptional regulator [Planctomycetes bacterium]|nr:GntR family transcriptional regulator [Planctomycetota bacterium]